VGADAAGEPSVGPGYEVLRGIVGRVDYLVMLGDILDFSVTGYEVAYRSAKAFFARLLADGIAQQVIYVPGNHDFDIWHTVEHQVNVINQLKQGQLPRAFKRAVPGIIDDREGQTRNKLRLPDVTAKPEWHENRRPYGNLFLDHITRLPATEGRPRAVGPKLPFNFAYPNLYLVTDAGESVLLTHGHYFEAYWSLASDWAMRLARDDLGLEEGELSLQDMVGINLPLNQLACSGIGQARPLTRVARAVQREATAGRTDRLAKYLDRLERALRSGAGRSLPVRTVHAWALRWLSRRFLDSVATLESSRYSADFTRRPAVRQRFRSYYRQSLGELRRISESHGIRVPEPAHVVFGHTHQPIPWGSEELIDVVDGRTVRLCNTGGWIWNPAGGAQHFNGAEVLLYETGRGIWSESVREPDLRRVPGSRTPVA
jgi:UDP-2,3-diacylglucosamine pyrophosphatase LpxH